MEEKYITTYAASKKYGISRDKIDRLVRDGIVKQNKSGKVAELMIKVALEAEKESENSSSAEINLFMKKAWAKYRAEKAKLAEIERKRIEGELIPVRDVENSWTETASILKSQIMSWSSKLPPLLEKKTKKQIGEILKVQINELLEKLSKNGQ